MDRNKQIPKETRPWGVNWKWCTNWKLRIIFYSADKTEDRSLGHSLSDKLRRGNGWWCWIYSDFCNKDQVVGTSKGDCYLKKSRHLKLRDVALFYVREDARCSVKSRFGMHLSYLGPVSGSWWWTGRPDVLQFMGSQRVGHDWATELTE